jgi:hypothetical protein
MVDIRTGPEAADAMASWSIYGARLCLQAVSRAFQRGDASHTSQVDPLVSVSTAAQHWAAMPAQFRHPGDRNYAAIPKGAVIQCTGGDGHIFISMGGGLGVSTDYPSAGRISVAPIADILGHFSNPYAGWGEWINGRQIQLAQPAGPKQRVAVAIGANARPQPNTSQPIVAGKGVLGGQVGNFDGWIHGEAVSGNDVWFHGAISGNWFWSGGFTDTGTHDLTDLNPVNVPTPDPTTRMVLASAGANKRSDPSTQKASIGGVAAGTVIEMTGFAHGQAVSNANANTDIWYTDGTGWYWSGGFTTQDTTGLTDLSSQFQPPTVIPMASFGIDVNGDKDGIDFVKAKADGAEFVIVKLGGHNTSQQYVGDKYQSQVKRVSDAGLFLGHYYVTGKGDPLDEATFFVNNLHGFDDNSDVLMLDNELFNHGPNGDQNVNSEMWDDDTASAFFQKVHDLTGIPFTRLWHYFNETAYGQQSWPKTEALGVRKIPANYYSNPTARTVQNVPALSEWWATQFSSQQTVGGFGPLDGYWSQHTAAELFAKGDVVVTTPPDNGGSTTTPPDSGDTAPNWFVGFITAIINAIKTWLTGQGK